MLSQRGQATVEWTALVLVVAALLAGVVGASRALGAAGLPQRLVCAIAGRACAPRAVFAAGGFTLPAVRMRVGVREAGGPPGLAALGSPLDWAPEVSPLRLAARVAPFGAVGKASRAGLAAARDSFGAVGDAAGFLWRHRRTVRKVLVATLIGTGVAATCAAAIIAANAIGAVACGSAIIGGSFSAYDNATS